MAFLEHGSQQKAEPSPTARYTAFERMHFHRAGRVLSSAILLAGCGEAVDLDAGYGYYGSPDGYDNSGAPGGACRADVDCSTLFCCTERKHCGEGMCTLPCRDDAECPAGTACEHGVCLFACASDADCAVGQRCGHDHRVCEWQAPARRVINRTPTSAHR